MIRRQKKAFVAADAAYQSDNGNNIKENLPITALIVSPSSNGYFHIGSPSTRKNVRYRRSRKNLKSTEKYNFNRILMVAAVGILYCFCMSYYTILSYSKTNKGLHSHTTSLNYSFSIIFPPERYRIPSPQKLVLPNTLYMSASEDKQDFGGLSLRFPEYHTSQDRGRIIYHDTYEDTGYEKLWNNADDDGSMDSYYAFDDDEKRNPLVMYDDPDIHLRKKCRRTNWHRRLPITCNSIHEFNFQSHIAIGDTKYVGYVNVLFFN
jgi:hypothetical protein